MLIGSAILPPSILVFAVTTDVRWMILAALAAGVGEGAFLSSWNAIIADQTTVEQRNVAFALSFVLNNVFLRRRTRLALLVPVHSGADRSQQPNGSRRGARPHRRTRIRHAGRLLLPPAGLPRNDPDPRGPPEGDGLEAAPQVLGDQRPHRPRRGLLHPPR